VVQGNLKKGIKKKGEVNFFQSSEDREKGSNFNSRIYRLS